jgi:transcriptional regulator NrdR family protein
MKKIRKLAWESWNSKFETVEDILEDDGDEEIDSKEINELLVNEMLFTPPRIIHTPVGEYAEDCLLRPMDRWDCWICHSNFDITAEIAEKIEKIEGIEALKIMGRYSFFIGIAKMFDFTEVRNNIEKTLCAYTEEEILSNEEIEKTVNLVKEQLKFSDYWSILVSPSGDLDYISSDKMDKKYLDGLSELILLSNKIGGIVLRSENG